jgi:survival-of-motor-neuron-related-splicing factor 30
VNLTKELLAEAQQQENATAAAAAAAPIAAAPDSHPSSSTLPPTVAQQIKLAQQRAALAGHGSAAWAIGAEIQAKYSGDGMWYDASVTGVNEEGNFIVTFTAYNIQEVVLRHDIRQKAAGGAAEYKGKNFLSFSLDRRRRGKIRKRRRK